MHWIPEAARFSKQLPKKAIYAKFNMNTAAKEKFDGEISRINIIAELSPATTNLAAGETIGSIFVLQVLLKKKDFDEKTIAQISKLIDQNMLLVLEYEGEQKLAVYHTKLIQSPWKPTGTHQFRLEGLDLDALWEKLIIQIGGIQIEQDHTLDQQIAVDDQKAKIQKEIDRLTKLAKKEKQPKKKFEIVQQINKFKLKLEV